MTRKLAAGVFGVLALAGVLAGCGHGTSPPASRATGPQQAASRAAAALSHPTGKFFGVEAAGAPDSLAPVAAVAASVGRAPNLVGQFVAWGTPFDATAAGNTVRYEALYYIAWEPWRTTVQAIASGASDAYITSFAIAVRHFGHPVAISFGHEMNGNWYPWGSTKTTAADFVAAWRHIHDLFAKAGADNVIWIWNPNVISGAPDVPLAPYWPGAAYVDWVGISGYFTATGPSTFDSLYGSTIAEVRQFTGKPILIAETAVETGPGAVASLRSLFTGVATSSDVVGLIWFNYVLAGYDWTFGDRPAVRAAAASLLARMRLVALGN